MMDHTFDDNDFVKIAQFINERAAEQAYGILMEHGTLGFSKDFPMDKLLDGLIAHYATTEDYEKCAELSDLQAEVAVERLIENNLKKPFK